jgi:hypothetical protein
VLNSMKSTPRNFRAIRTRFPDEVSRSNPPHFSRHEKSDLSREGPGEETSQASRAVEAGSIRVERPETSLPPDTERY